MAGIFDLVSRGLKGTGILGGGEGAGNEARLGGDDVGRGFAGGLFNRPGASEALIAFGANMLAAPSFGQGMGAGATAFLDTLRTEEDRRRPKNQFLADGAIQASTDPMTGEVTFAGVQPVQEWQTGLMEAKQDNSIEAILARDDARRGQIEMQAGFSADQKDADRNTRLMIAQMQQAGAGERALIAAMSRGERPAPMMPSSARNRLDDILKERDAYQSSYDAVSDTFEDLVNGNLDLGLWNNAVNKMGLAGIGAGGRDMVEYQRFLTNVERARNAILIGNKGVQTEGDAMRAMDQIISGKGNKKTAIDAISRYLVEITKKGTQATQRANRYAQPYGEEPIEGLRTRQFKRNSKTSASPASKAPKRITSDAQFNALPSGSTFIGPDGKIRRKP